MYNVSPSPSQLGYFLDFSLWKDAKKLLDFQIKQMEDNKHYNTLSMFYYKQIVSVADALETEEYFKQRVANNLFYALEREFAVYNYVIPKSYLGIRNYKFFTYPMRVLYYSIGLYLLKLSQDFWQSYVNSHARFKCYYGGNLYFNKDSLIIKHKTTFYKHYYKEFKPQVKQQLFNNFSNKLVIKLDVQNYFDTVSIQNLLDKLDSLVKPSIKEKLRFDTSTREQIIFLFNYISGNKCGIPQADNDIISGFIGHLYLIFVDLAIDTEICKYKTSLKEHKIIRFVDDTFIIINFLESVKQQEKEFVADSLTSKIADILHYKSGLRLNTKTRLYWLNSPEQKEEILKDLKKVSFEYPSTDDNEETPENKIAKIFVELQKLKASRLDISLCPDGSIQEEILKEVYDKSVNQLLEKEENQKKIEEVFTNFNFNLVKNAPTEIIAIISKSQNVLDDFENFLSKKVDLTTRDLFLIIKFLCQTSFKNIDLFKNLKNSEGFNHIAAIYQQAQINSNLPGYYNLSDKQVILLAKEPHIIEQIRLRIFNEKNEFYSVAMNHLLNEIHAICMVLDTKSKSKEYEADDAIKYLASICVPHDICIGIRNLFDRRNRNTVSHPGSVQYIAWGVTKTEYIGYHTAVGKCLKIILNRP